MRNTLKIMFAILLVVLLIFIFWAPKRPEIKIHKGLYWKKSVPFDKHLIINLSDNQQNKLRTMLEKHLKYLSDHRLSLVGADRTIVIKPEGLKIVYGDSMGEEFGVTGSLSGFFRSKNLYEYLKKLEYNKHKNNLIYTDHNDTIQILNIKQIRDFSREYKNKRKVNTTIKQILSNSGKSYPELLKFEGIIKKVQKIYPNSDLYYYIIGDDKGNQIKVNTSSKPNIEKKYIVEGLLRLDIRGAKPLIAEVKRYDE